MTADAYGHRHVRVALHVGDDVLVATLDDSAAARDFAALLPLTVTLTDFHGTEKVAELPRRLRTDDSPSGTSAEVGDLAYYAPWGNLAIFTRPFPRAEGLVLLGRFVDGIDALTTASEPLEVVIESTPRPRSLIDA